MCHELGFMTEAMQLLRSDRLVSMRMYEKVTKHAVPSPDLLYLYCLPKLTSSLSLDIL